MKRSSIFVIVSLANCCFFLGDGTPEKFDCRQYYRHRKRPEPCSKEYVPVCGSDGHTYDNTCMLCDKIMRGTKVALAHKGKCPHVCSKYRESEIPCSEEKKPVCCTQGVTYSNLCTFCNEWRKYGGTFDIKNEGECKKQDREEGGPPAGDTGGGDDKQEENGDGEKMTVPPEDGKEEPPGGDAGVGDDKQDANGDGEEVTVPPEDGKKEKPPGGDTDVGDDKQDANGDGEEVTAPPEDDKKEEEPPRGDAGDDKQDENDDEMTASPEDIKEEEEPPGGGDDQCSDFPDFPENGLLEECEEYKPVCGNDGVTYGSLCLFCMTKKKRKDTPDIKHDGECDEPH